MMYDARGVVLCGYDFVVHSRKVCDHLLGHPTFTGGEVPTPRREDRLSTEACIFLRGGGSGGSGAEDVSACISISD